MSGTPSAPTSAVGGTLPVAPPGTLSAVDEPQAVACPNLQQNDSKVQHCEQCKTSGARNLVVCIDGTSNQFSKQNTNVVELYSRLVKDKTQLTFYNSGIGTYAKPSWKSLSYRRQVISNKLDLAFALRFEKIILSAYAWLVDNYEPGDRIFLFGFSRGAYQVRALAAMISIVGLLYKGNNDQIPFAYELYAASNDEDTESHSRMETLRRFSAAVATRVKGLLKREKMPSTDPDSRLHDANDPSMQDLFKATFSQPDVRVHFVGAWDTVSSVGFIRDKTLPKTTDGMKCSCFFRHALALHEFRVKFLPEYVNGSRGPESDPVVTVPHTKEVWFAGSHSDIGGGSTTNTTLDKFGPALRWMSHEATLAGLRLKEGQRKWDQGMVSNSMTFIWRMVECLPIKRLSYTHWDPTLYEHGISEPTSQGSENMSPKLATTLFPHLCARRSIQPGQRIYWSVDRRLVPFRLPTFAVKEQDAYATLLLRPNDESLRVGCIIDERNSTLLQLLTSTEDGIESLRELNIMGYIYDMAQFCWKNHGPQQILKDLHLLNFAYIKGMVAFEEGLSPMHASDFREPVSSATFPFNMIGHKSAVSSVSFLSDTRVISGSYDGTLRIWDVSTGEMILGSPLGGDMSRIYSVAVHTANGLVAYASNDSTIRLWTSDHSGAIRAGEVLHDGSRGGILAVAFSPDGSYLVSGSRSDSAIRFWNTATGKRVGEPVRGHADWVRSVAFSPDGNQLVSGSDDCTVRLWEWSRGEATLKPCGGPLVGHTNWVFSVAFSPDARVIASGSADRTVRIWDMASRTPKFTLDGHTGGVLSVAFAPSRTHVVSGSSDWTVRIWDFHTGAAVRVLRGHTNSVWSVEFSPDGTRIASGSDDGTVRVSDFVLPLDDSHCGDEAQAAPARIDST